MRSGLRVAVTAQAPQVAAGRGPSGPGLEASGAEGPRSVFAEQFELVVNIVALRFDILLTFDLRKRQFHLIQPNSSVPVPFERGFSAIRFSIWALVTSGAGGPFVVGGGELSWALNPV